MKKPCPQKLREAGASLASVGAWSFLFPRKEGSGSASVLCKGFRYTRKCFNNIRYLFLRKGSKGRTAKPRTVQLRPQPVPGRKQEPERKAAGTGRRVTEQAPLPK